ncbi:hypothetical protein, conserved [Babesia ovata]|uniref:C3H1-type domain-containing protein n=1 Tax=Babesia ovata TaxID=189622 RepID=A0A2H6KKE2_9APIC|nr:uncharacterized protein BOVATA_049560 [Babesia ovata]GBE63463.1 hypothetical protein, conserved [Babesia ovata]
MVSLAELSGQLGQFIGNSDAVADAIQNGIDTIIDSDDDFKSLKNSSSSTVHPPAAVPAVSIDTNMLDEKIQHYEKEIERLKPNKNNQNPPLSSEESRLLSSHQSKLDALQRLSKLNESLSSLNKQQSDNCKNLLTNLCSGLEKFLGYQETSKGYDGSGIVYSDLDRLCDGMMAFLHGVLQSVKDDESVTKYDITPDKMISSLPSKIGEFMHNGSNGLQNAITQVSEALRAWSGELEERTERVSKHLDTLSKNIDSNISSVRALHDFDVAARQWYTTVTDGLGDKVSDVNNAIAVLDSELKIKLASDFDKIQLRIDDFAGSAMREQTEMRELGESVQVEFKDLQQRVIKEAERLRDACISVLKNEFDANIKVPIEHVVNSLGQVKTNLDSWSIQAKASVNAALETVGKIMSKLNGSRNGRNGEMNDETKHITDAAWELANKATLLLDAIDVARETLGNKVSTAEDAIILLDKAVKMDLYYVKGQIQMGIRQYVMGIVKDIETKVKKISGTEGDDGGLKKTVDQVKAWALDFKTPKGFEERVKEWIGDILDSDDIVEGKLETYVNNNNKLAVDYQNATVGSEQYLRLTNVIEQQIVEKLKEGNDSIIQQASQMVQIEEGDTTGFEEYVTAVASGCLMFSTKLGNKITKEGQFGSFADSIAGMIEKVVVPGGTSGKKNNLKLAVHSILLQLLGAANQTAEYLKWLTGTDPKQGNMTNVEAALKITKLLESELNKALNTVLDPHAISPPGPPYKASDNIDRRITEILDGQLPNAAQTVQGTSEVELKAENFPYYLGGTRGPGKKENLETAIKAIKAEVENNLNNINYPEKGGHMITSDTISMAFDAVKERLENFINVVKDRLDKSPTDRKNTVKNYLTDIQKILENQITVTLEAEYSTSKAVIPKGLDGIRHDIVNILEKTPTNNLQNVLAEAQKFHGTTTRTTVMDCITGINAFLSQQVTEKTAAIKRDALNRYVESAKQQLEALKTEIGERRKSIEGIIFNDRSAGIKGLLDKLDKQFVTEVTTINPKSPQITLKNAAENVNSGFKKLLESTAKQDGIFFASVYIKELSHHLGTLLGPLTHFDHVFVANLNRLDKEVKGILRARYTKDAERITYAIGTSLGAFVKQLNCAYVNTYSGYTLTDADEKHAKVCLTSLSILRHELVDLRKACGGLWRKEQINCSTDLGLFLKSRGYGVATKVDSQDGELRNCTDMRGLDVRAKVGKEIDRVNSGHILTCKPEDKNHINIMVLLACLCDHLGQYYNSCHYIMHPKPAPPCNVYQMLDGLQHHVKTLFDKPKDRKNDDYSTFHPHELKLDATVELSAETVTSELDVVCRHAEVVLIAIQGHGHAEGRYACDFCTNVDKLHYPSSPAACLELLSDILCRIYHQLYYVLIQCERTTAAYAWNECLYGKGVGGSNWICNELQCPEQTCNLSCDQTCKQTCDQKHNQQCPQKHDQQVSCGFKSPLQSYLEDGLPGFLPHQFKTPGCKLTCNMSNHRGLPCKTPMGFGELSVTASHTKTGAHLKRVLGKFCGQPESPLSKMCSLLICLSPRPPQSLDDMFAFYYNFIVGWGITGRDHKSHAFSEAVNKAYFGENYVDLHINSIFTSDKSNKHSNGDLMCLVGCVNNGLSTVTCGRYLHPFSQNTWAVYSSKHAGLYLSWIVYLTETFYDFLKMLYDECCKNCNTPGSRCHESCPVTCPTLDKSPRAHDAKHDPVCKSIAKCPLTRPTLCKYGFVLKSSSNLNGAIVPESKRTCKDLCNALERVVKEGNLLYMLVHKIIPDFIWAIRTPFTYLLLALWSLSLLYLLHIAVVRLDVLRIRSHLRSPSSHRIAAQSLLAAARVKALANVKYFSP